MYFIAAGVFQDPKAPTPELRRQLKLVRPSGGRPYIMTESDKDRRFALMRHHSHLYLISQDLTELILVEQSSDAYPVEAPIAIPLPPFLQEDIRKAISELHPPSRINPNCDLKGCHHAGGEVRNLPTGPKTGPTSSINLCYACFQREISHRRERNKQLGSFAQFDLPNWQDLEVSCPADVA